MPRGNSFFRERCALALAIGYKGMFMPAPRDKASKKSTQAKAEPEREAPEESKKPEAPEGMVDVAVLPIWSTLQIFLGILDRVAWLRMGLVVNPETQKIEKDMEQARAAIDCYEAILKALGDKLQPDAKRQLEAHLTDLKLNYASHT
jgi:hypothetical protein